MGERGVRIVLVAALALVPILVITPSASAALGTGFAVRPMRDHR